MSILRSSERRLLSRRAKCNKYLKNRERLEEELLISVAVPQTMCTRLEVESPQTITINQISMSSSVNRLAVTVMSLDTKAAVSIHLMQECNQQMLMR